jgi:TolB-like protein
MSGNHGFLDELRKRGVVRAALLYVAAAFALLEFADIAFPRLGLPDGAVNWVLWVGLAGFPLTLLASWAIEVRAERDSGQIRSWLSPATLAASFLLIALGVGMGLIWGGTELGSSSIAEPAAPRRADERSVAVLPFENMSQDASNEPFTIGIHDDLVAHISRISSIKTISRTSVLQYRDTTKTIPQIASELGVATILEGGVQRSGDRVRINVQLIDAASDAHVWSETYDRQLTAADIFSIQSEIATSIAEAMRAHCTGSPMCSPGRANGREPCVQRNARSKSTHCPR